MAPVCRSACRQLRCLCVLSLTLFWYCSVAATRSYDRNTLLDLRYALASPTFYDGYHPPFTCPIADCVIRLPCCISDRRKRRRRRGKRGGVRVRIRRGASASSVQLGPCQRSKDILGRNDLYLARRSWDLSENQSDDCQEQGYRFQSFHQRVVGFSNDPYHHESRSDLPDIVTAGVLQGFYPRDVKVSFKKSSGKPSGLTCAPELPVHPRIPTITINRSDISSESERI